MNTGASAIDLRDKVALITGGAGGLGSAVCVALAAAGAEVVVADIDLEGATRVAGQVGGHAVRLDVADPADNATAVAFAVQACGGLDLVHLNAGISTGCGIGDDFDLALYRRAMAINCDGVVFGVNAALPALRARGGGAIVATASLAGLTGVPMDPIYAGNKHAVVGLVRSLGPSLAADGVRINAVCPGYAESAIIEPIRDAILASGVPIIPAERVAAAVLALFAGDAAGECWFVQPGREAGPFAFRNIPGPRAEPAPGAIEG